MTDVTNFGSVLPNWTKHQTFIENYLIRNETVDPVDDKNKFYAFQEPRVSIMEPKVCAWEFMNEDEVTKFLQVEKASDIHSILNSKIQREYPKGIARRIFLQLMYNVRQFCIQNKFDVETTEKIYKYFKELTMCHSLPFPPRSKKIFLHVQTKAILEFFFKIYVRNLQLIRFLSLPNFALYFHYELPEVVVPVADLPKSAKKSDKGKKKGGKKGKK